MIKEIPPCRSLSMSATLKPGWRLRTSSSRPGSPSSRWLPASVRIRLRSSALPARAGAGGRGIRCIWLVVDDNKGDGQLVREALTDTALPVEFHAAADARAALAFLRPEGAYATAPRPTLMLLDLNLPVINGLALLGAVKGDGALPGMPVVMWSGSQNREDVSRSYALGASAYMVKPARFERYCALVKTLFTVWCAHEVHSL
jgi:chemotaxis family two-component system response regulator Rcp1